jgi:hypothetical protein
VTRFDNKKTWLQEQSCRLFAFTHGVSRRLRQGSGKWQKAAKKPL